MKMCFPVILLFISLCFLPITGMAQGLGEANVTVSTNPYAQVQTSVTTISQGLAWVDTATSQIVRIHTELLAPLPELRLDKQTMDVDFHEVHFTHMNQTVWLPEEVLVSLDWNGKRLRNRHEYSDYKVFDVDASEKIGQPKGFAEPSPSPDSGTSKQLGGEPLLFASAKIS